MPISPDLIMRECFEGDRERSCTYCPAHYSKNGRCCFGHRFEYDDPQCHGCLHCSACEQATARFQDQHAASPRRIVINRPTASPLRPGAAGTSTVYGQTAPIRRDGGVIMPQNRAAKPLQPSYEESFWKMMGLNAVWGAVEGALEMLLGFFRQRRPD